MKFETLKSHVNKGTNEYRFVSRGLNVSVYKRDKQWKAQFSINVIVDGFKEDTEAILFAKKTKARVDKFITLIGQK